MIRESDLTAGALYSLVASLLGDDNKLRGMEEKSQSAGQARCRCQNGR